VIALLAAGEAAWREIIALELWNGVTLNQRAKLEALKSLVVPLTINASTWLYARKVASAARAAGLTIPVPDLLVAACAQIHRLDIEHHKDEHFVMTAGLNI
jgi:predicted nucleic acid-binding protein